MDGVAAAEASAIDKRQGAITQVRKQVRSMRGAGPVKDALRAAQRAEAEAARLRRKAAALREKTAGRPEASWRAFESIMRVLVDAGATTSVACAPLSLGLAGP